MKTNNYLTLDKEFLDYCKLNNIEDIDKLARETFSRGFTILKYGEKRINQQIEKPKEEIKIKKIESSIYDE